MIELAFPKELISTRCLKRMLLMMFMNLNNITILDIDGADYRCIINEISKSEAINILQNINLAERSGTL